MKIELTQLPNISDIEAVIRERHGELAELRELRNTVKTSIGHESYTRCAAVSCPKWSAQK